MHSTPRRNRRRREWALSAAFVVSGLIATATVGCGVLPRVADLGEVSGGTEADAAALVETWFREARSRAGDRGWALLHPVTRTKVIDSADAYRNAVDGTDWTGLQYAVRDARSHDGHYHVTVRVAGGQDHAPGFMLDWGLIQFAPIDGEPTMDGSIQVRIDPWGGPSGILGG